MTAAVAVRRRTWRPSVRLELVLGATLGVLLLFGVIVVVTVVNFRLGRRWVHYGD